LRKRAEVDAMIVVVVLHVAQQRKLRTNSLASKFRRFVAV
jgi:hypothetical protein